MALLDARRRASVDRPVTIGIFGENAAGRARLAEAGWTERPGGPRLLRGEPLDWRPDVDLRPVHRRDWLNPAFQAAASPASSSLSSPRAASRSRSSATRRISWL